MPWDELVNVYQKQMNNSKTGADGINPRVVIGALIIKHMCDFKRSGNRAANTGKYVYAVLSWFQQL